MTVAAVDRSRAGRRVARLRSAGPQLDVAVVAAVVVLAGLARLPNLDRYTISFPEGIRAEQLLLMAAGYRPCVDIFCNQGPLLFYALFPTFALFGQTLEALRAGVVLFSLVGIAATYWSGLLLAGRPAALVATILLALSPTYLKFSRLALAEVPATAVAVLAVGAAFRFQAHGRDRWLVASALLLAFSLQLKPITLAACVPVGLCVLFGPGRRVRNVGLLAIVTAAAIAVPTALIGASEVFEQVVAFRLRSRVAEGRGLAWNGGRIWEELSADGPGVIALSCVGAAIALVRRRDRGAPLVAWAIAALVLLLIHTPLHGKHVVTLLPPITLLAGTGWSLAWRQAARSLAPRPRPPIVAAAVVISTAAYLAFLPATLARDRALLFDPRPLENDPAAYWYPEVVRTLGQVTSPDEMVVTDHPYLPFEARRLVPPPLVEASVTRILAGSLTADDAIAQTGSYDAAAVLLWADKLTTLRPFKAWVDRTYVPIRVYAADGEATPTLYVRPDRAAAIASASTSPDRPPPIEFEGGLRLTDYRLDRANVAGGGVASLDLTWQAVARPAADYRAVVQIRRDDQIFWRSDELPLAGLGPGPSSWQPGRSMSLSALIRVPRSLPTIDYAVSVRLYDPRARRFVDPLGDRSGAEGQPRPDPKGVTVATLTVAPTDQR